MGELVYQLSSLPNLVFKVAGFVFRFSSEKQVWNTGPGNVLFGFLSDRPDVDFAIRFLWEKGSAEGSTFDRQIETKSLSCSFTSDFGQGEIRLAVSPDVFYAFQASYLELITRIVLVASGRAFPFHACGIKAGDTGFVFTGPSGAGKTTMACLWREREGAIVLSDERLWLRLADDGQYWIYGAPLRGRLNCFSGKGAPLSKIYFIRHEEENVIAPKSGVQALIDLLEQAHLRVYHQLGVKLPIDFYVDLVRKVPCYDLGFVPTPQIVDFIQRIS